MSTPIKMVGSPRANGLPVFEFVVYSTERADDLVAHPDRAVPPCDWVKRAADMEAHLRAVRADQGRKS